MSLSGLGGCATGQVLNRGYFVQAARLEVMGTTYLADFYGSLALLLDPNRLSQFLAGAVSVVPLLIQEHVADGVGNLIGAITVRMDQYRAPPDSTLTAVVAGRPFPAVQDFIVNIHVTIPNLLPGITLRNK